MALLTITPATQAGYDCLALGEVMLRLDPGEQRIRRADRFQVWEGGGEYNVVQGLSSCFGQRTGIITSLVDNEVGQLIAGLIRRSGVDGRWIRWLPHDGMGLKARNGLYFMERGFGERAAKAVMDRGHTAIAQLRAGDIDWPSLFKEARPRWFHVGGVIAGLSEQAPELVLAAMTAAREQGAVVSYDLNYRDSLWRERGGRSAAAAVNEKLIGQVDVLFGVDQLSRTVDALESGVFAEALERMQARFANLKILVTTQRVMHDASHNSWSGMCLAGGEIHQATAYDRLPIFDRVGGGDAFAAGFIYGLLQGDSVQRSLDIAVAHGALVMSTPGDNSMFGLDEVLAFAGGGDASALR
ncbi:PfkB family carbohydrate kinase [Nitrincola sp. MINF-07-Sa-05]|uniref:PfkB family carbohydrate kinase n=1 Tax=Nitrincola salilacus TaxID=3400273 RepID=UPI0039183B71